MPASDGSSRSSGATVKSGSRSSSIHSSNSLMTSSPVSGSGFGGGGLDEESSAGED